jgi:hypothetical protein
METAIKSRKIIQSTKRERDYTDSECHHQESACYRRIMRLSPKIRGSSGSEGPQEEAWKNKQPKKRIFEHFARLTGFTSLTR